MKIVQIALALLLCGPVAASALAETLPRDPSDIPPGFAPDPKLKDYEQHTVLIPMRDGIKLSTIIITPRGLTHAPIILARTPYSADKMIDGAPSNRFSVALPTTLAALAGAGYIIAVQDVRGRYNSEGDYVITRPLTGPLNPTGVDHATDTWDTIDWLVKNVPANNGKVGTIGVSYVGFTTLMSLVHSHPALKAAVPINPLADGWTGDDWFHNGAYRQSYLDWVYRMSADKSSKYALQFDRYDTYETWLKAGSVADMAKQWGIDRFPMFQRIAAHPAYDAYWQSQALPRILRAEPLTVPTLHVHSLWDQEDIYGAQASYAAMEANDRANDKNFLVIGPWHHGQSWTLDGSSLGEIDFNGNSSQWFRENLLIPFFDRYLKDDGAPADVPPVTAFETGANEWHRYSHWPMSCASGCPFPSKPIFLDAAGGLKWSVSSGSKDFVEYISDPAHPVTYRERPILSTYNTQSTWKRWLVDDQRFAESRPDVVTFTSDVLTEDVRVAGQPIAKFFASTSGTDSDWVVKLIDVYPAEYADKPSLGGYELPIAMDILRGRYRDDPSKPTAIPSDKVVSYQLKLPPVSHRFMKGHRIMVQIQSSWFPLYDRNPQKFVPNIFFAAKTDYVKATQRIYASEKYPSQMDLPVMPSEPKPSLTELVH